jgi:archaellum component FlaC
MATSDDIREQFRSLENGFDGLDQKLVGLEGEFNGLEERVDRLPTKDELDGFKSEIIKDFRILAEEAKQSARNAAEGYGTTLEKIERDVAELKQEMVPSFQTMAKR